MTTIRGFQVPFGNFNGQGYANLPVGLTGDIACVIDAPTGLALGSTVTSGGSSGQYIIAYVAGAWTVIGGPSAASPASIPNDTPMLGDILATDIAAPATPAAGKDRIWVDSTDKRLHDKNDAGTIGTTVVASSAGSHQFATGIGAAGVISYAQPDAGDLTASWAAYTPAMTASGGSAGIAASTSSGRYCQLGKIVHFMADLKWTNLGSWTGTTLFSLPVTAKADGSTIFSVTPGIELTNSWAITAQQRTTTIMTLLKYDASLLLATAHHYIVQGTYEAA